MSTYTVRVTNGGIRPAAIAVAFACFAAVGLVDAQSRPPAGGGPEAAQAPFRAGVELVSLNVTVTGTGGKYVTDLQRDDFSVFEDGVKQDVTFFSR